MASAPNRKSSDRNSRSTNIIDLKAAQARKKTAQKLPLTESVTDTRAKALQNVAAMILIVGLAAGGAYLIAELRKSQSIQSCIDSGRRDCARIDIGR